MRWVRPRPEETRIRRKFLWFPKRINGVTRWLETAEWEEYWVPGDILSGSWYSRQWIK